MIRNTRSDRNRHGMGSLYMTQEMSQILAEAAKEVNDPALAQNIYFSPTALTHIRRIVENGGTIVTDTQLVASGIDTSVLAGKNVRIKCFIDAPEVTNLAEQRRTTRAEVAADFGIAEQGLKLLVYGSAPAGIQRVMRHRQSSPLSEVCVLAGSAGFAGSIQLKEKLTESDMACIVIRGKKGGIPTTTALLNAILRQITKER